jgi:uncharacterized protein (DUF2252 family)
MPAEEAARGKEARQRAPRESHAGFTPPADRDDPVALLERQAETRLPDLVPVRYGRMLESAFAYFRGAALPMAADLARTPVSGLTVQACGDAHLSNFGVFGTPERRLIFDVNDFDETLPGPWEWDVKRLAASLEVAGRDNGYSAKQRTAVVVGTVARYREAMRHFAGMTDLDVWYTSMDSDRLRSEIGPQLNKSQRKRVNKGEVKARSSDSMKALSKLTTIVDGKPRFIADPPLIVPADDLTQGYPAEQELETIVVRYRRTLETDRRFLLDRYQFADAARKVVGVGSVGTRCWIVLLFGRDENDPLILQVKEAQQSVLAAYVGPSRFSNQGQRVVTGQRLMQAASDIFLGWNRVDAALDGQQRDFYVRQLRDWKFSIEIGRLAPNVMRLYGESCGWTLARAHARSGERIAIAAYLGGSDVFDQAIAAFASDYADQNEHDYRDLQEAVSSGRVKAVSDLLRSVAMLRGYVVACGVSRHRFVIGSLRSRPKFFWVIFGPGGY